MKTVTRLLTIGFSLAALMACTSVPGPNEALGRPEPVTSPPVAVAQLAAQAAPQSAALPQSAATGYLSPAFGMNAEPYTLQPCCPTELSWLPVAFGQRAHRKCRLPLPRYMTPVWACSPYSEI